MAKFCGKCGSKLDEQTGKCPNCDIENESSVQNKSAPTDNDDIKQTADGSGISDKKSDDKKKSSEEKKNHGKKDKKASKKEGRKVKKFFLKFLITVLILATLTAVSICVLSYYGAVDVPAADAALAKIGVKKKHVDEDETPPEEQDKHSGGDETKETEDEQTNADDYFENNSKVISEIDVNDSYAVSSESETFENLTERGFTTSPITAEYSMDGQYYKASEISKYSSSKHPIYQTYHVTESGNVWTIFEINGVIMANPAFYNIDSDADVQLIVSESDAITSYDAKTNKFYETIPDKSALTVRKVERIDAETLEKLTFGALENE